MWKSISGPSIKSTMQKASRGVRQHRQLSHNHRPSRLTSLRMGPLSARSSPNTLLMKPKPRFFSSSSDASNNSSGSRLGTWLIRLGWGLLGLVALDQALQYKQELEAKDRMKLLADMQQEANEMNQPEWDSSLPALFQCKIAYVEPTLDGTKMLANIRVGDIVEVVEAKVGPNQAYHLCRRPAQGRRPQSMGWYPVEFMETV